MQLRKLQENSLEKSSYLAVEGYKLCAFFFVCMCVLEGEFLLSLTR